MIDKFLTARAARTDARHGQNSIDTRITAAQGLQPSLDPTNNIEHGELVRAYSDTTKIHELEEDLARLRDSLSGQPPLLWLFACLVFAIAVESLGGVWILRDMGTEPRSRWLFGIGLAITLVGITAVTARASSSASTDATGGAKNAKRSKWSFLVLIAYSLCVLGVTIVRVQSAIDDETSNLATVGSSILTLALSVGPAWFAEHIIRKFATTKTTRDRIRNLRRQLRDAKKTQQQARAAVIGITRAREKWANDAARRKAIYETQHRLESSKVLDEKR